MKLQNISTEYDLCNSYKETAYMSQAINTSIYNDDSNFTTSHITLREQSKCARTMWAMAQLNKAAGTQQQLRC